MQDLNMKQKMTSSEFKKHIANKFSRGKSSSSQSANALTKAALQMLDLYGFEVWRQNNHATFRIREAAKMLAGMIAGAKFSKQKVTFLQIENRLRKFYAKRNTTKGVADIIGHCRRTGVFVAVEVKTEKDKLSIHQVAHLKKIKESGGFSHECRNIEGLEKSIKEYRGLS